MQLVTAYISVVLIWATTPLAIQWSSESVGFLFGISSRMILGAVIAFSLITFLGKKIAWNKKAIQTYIAVGLGLFTAMLSVYWSSQFIPSGWISTIYGITPVFTGLFAMKLLGERGLNSFRLFAIVLGIIGLFIMFDTGLKLSPDTGYGIFGVLMSSIFYSLSMVIVKKINADIETYSTMTGGLIVAAILFLIVWNIFGVEIPTTIPTRAGFSILYLSIIGSVVGFYLFYFVLKRVEATRVSLITLMTPVCALFLGNILNNEPLSLQIVIGSAFILSGLLLFEFEGAIRQRKIINIEEEL
ncbi:MAG: DMT family transporter [Proteobacteria bacterium]|nr:DMT family transporter [Pseudomonadota bacterium]NOG61133.1 DMT family transporter [Pseudomonadota bacterium]